MYAAGKAPLRAVVGANLAGSEAGLVCYRTLANSPCLRAFASLRRAKVICYSDSGGCSTLHHSSIVSV